MPSSVFKSVRKTNNKFSHCCTNTVDTRSSRFVLISHLMKGKDLRLQNCHHIEYQFCKSRVGNEHNRCKNSPSSKNILNITVT